MKFTHKYSRMHSVRRRMFRATLIFYGASALFLPPQFAAAQAVPTVPGAADPSRIEPQKPALPSTLTPTPRFSTQGVIPEIDAPKGADTIRFIAKEISFAGMTQFSEADFSSLISPLENKEISLADIYALAGKITLRYKEAGFLLSYAYIPEQQIADGKVIIAVVEGYVAEIITEGTDPNNFITSQYKARITKQRPLKEQTLESTLLRINDLPGRSYRAILHKPEQGSLDRFKLTLVPQKKAPHASLSFDNFSSRYLGPNEINANISASIAPLQQTTLSALNSVPFDRLNYVQLNHSVAAFADATLEATASYAHSKPEFRLEPLDIESTTASFSAGLNYQVLRKRDENLLLGLHAGSRHVTSDIFTNTLLTRDEIRYVKASVSYDIQDSLNGANIVNVDFTQGLPILGASKTGDLNLSRAQAHPDFSKAELSVSRYQSLGKYVSALVQGSGQLSSGQLYASEEFGIGGQSVGRAYDNSEAVGDSGLSGSIELRYQGLRTLQPVNFEPFIFIDSGFVSNTDSAQKGYESLTSTGAGVRFASDIGQSGLVGVAFPLSRNPDAPIYGLGNNGPRILLQFSQQF